MPGSMPTCVCVSVCVRCNMLNKNRDKLMKMGCWYLAQTDCSNTNKLQVSFHFHCFILVDINIHLAFFSFFLSFFTHVLSHFASCLYMQTPCFGKYTHQTSERRRRDFACAFLPFASLYFFSIIFYFIFYLFFLPLVPFCLSFIMGRGRLEIKEASGGDRVSGHTL